MANEIEVSISLNASKGGVSVSRSESFKVDMSGSHILHVTQEIGATEEAIDLGQDHVGDNGWCFVKNLDSANEVFIGLTGSYTIKLLAGESTVFRNNGPIYADCSSGESATIEVIVLQA